MSYHDKTMSKYKSCVSIRRVIILAAIFILVRITWMSIQNMLAEPDPLQVDDLPPNMDFDVMFKPKECVIGVNKSCMPVNSDDVYLGRGLYAHQGNFYLDGRPFRILSGSFHYFRTHPMQWGDRLLKMKAAGLNTVMTYVPWNMHEPLKGHYMFGGDRDLASFIKQAQKVGLKVIVRPGPYICAEWEFGGLPAWLLQDPDMKVRTSYEPYMQHVSEYFSKLLYILAPLAYKKGGPIMAFQVENEYGSYGDDKVYLEFLVKQLKKWGIEELLFTSDGSKVTQLQRGSIPGVLVTVNFKEHQIEHFQKLMQFQPNKPLMVTEFWSGWFDHWEEHHHGMTNDVFKRYVTNILDHGASMNFYMFTGGTNFGFWNGANGQYNGKRYAPTITSYDYDAPISEDGTLKDKFFIVRELLAQFVRDPEELPDLITVTNTTRYTAYGSVKIEGWMSYKSLTEIAEELGSSRYNEKNILDHPVSMEKLDLGNGYGQSFGWLLYRSRLALPTPQMLTLNGSIHDRVQIIVNSKEVAFYYRNDAFPQVTLPPQSEGKSTVTLDLLVENMGRINYKQSQALDDQHKGILGKIYIGAALPRKWTHIPLDFDDEFIATVEQKENWQTYMHIEDQDQQTVVTGPSLFRAMLNLDMPPTDTYLDMIGWNKGIVIVNGIIIGRYWHVGPQRTLYIPGPILVQGRNVIIVFELHKPSNLLKFVDKPILDGMW